ncbi:Succinyl-CoA--L-malate CoA-transferase beta subunit [Lachnellula occidentalis]|uniref:Succinyl-CoA--L-malate CoA-transferase beta subunit n=1 Tax=Lachnellula occidentalis TaxID=215460 RepID=A0A8H8S641_9HELO|nr:Succinyl-CoA--L-malate CoA-transferase beta subunit [Lachnellula occidentalis]
MANSYDVQAEALRILEDCLLADQRLALPPNVREACKKVKFFGDSKPFIPTPCKITESCAALSALVGGLASAVASARYGIELQNIDIDTDKATLFIMSVMLPTVEGTSFLQCKEIRAALSEADIYNMDKPIHRQCTNVYKTKDDRWYHLHGSMNAGPTMRMLGVAEQDVTTEVAQKIYTEEVAKWDSTEIEKTANEQFLQAGTVCNTVEEFFASPHGKIMSEEPLYTSTPIKAPQMKWPSSEPGHKSLAGIKVLDFSRVIAAPVASKLLAVLGADVLKLSYTGNPEIDILMVDMSTGKRDANVNMKTEAGKAAFRSLVKDADIVIDGFRPGALEKLGFSSAALREINPSLIYMRENCYGFKGPLADRSGWQQISDCVVGISWLQGKFLGLDEPVVPLLPNSDYQTGLIGAAAAIQALLARTKSAVTFDIDFTLTQFNIWYYRLGQYDAEQSAALIARNPGFSVRHYDEMTSLLAKSYKGLQVSRPGLIEREDFYVHMSGKEWGVGDMKVLKPPFDLEVSELEWSVPSGIRGRSKPEWL